MLIGALGACGDDSGGGGISGGRFATLEAFTAGRPLAIGGTIGVSPAGLAVNEEKSVAELRLINTGLRTLEIESITLESNPPGAFRLASNPTTLEAVGQGPFEVVPQSEASGQRNFYVYVILKRPAAGVVPTATITVKSNNVNAGGEKQPVVTFGVAMEEGAASLQVVPKVVDFQTVAQGATSQKSVNLLNQGNDDLVIDGFALTGHPNFEMVIGTTRYPVSAQTSAGITLEEPIVIAAGEVQAVGVFYTATGPEGATGRIVFDSNDPNAAGGTVVDLQANVDGPCISVNPKRVDFGGKLIGRPARVEVTITSCGFQPLQLSEIVLLQDSAPEYTLALETLPGVGGEEPVGALGPQDPPVVLNPNQTARFAVQYIPEDLSPIDGTGLPIRDTGVVRIKSNAFAAETLIDVSGFGVDKECPTPVIVVQEGEEVIPQTRLHLIGSQSFAATGTIAKWEWRAIQPLGSASVFQPTATTPDPTFEVNVAGRYEFELTVTDSTGEESCAPARVEVFVNPDEAIHIELLWDTPNDTNPSDDGPEAGADLDLHVLHPFAIASGYDGDKDGKPDGYFDIPYDCFWFNDKPNWGSFQLVEDDPSLDRDDTDGAGPENVNLNLPENVCYKIGVHYWDDHGFGDSYATVKLYLYSSLVFEEQDVLMTMLDMWTVTDLCWPPDPGAPLKPRRVCEDTFAACTNNDQCNSGKSCGPLIVPNYQQSFLPQ
ncbi:MAG: hypothetical protein IT385_07780 [Deltaproteobacteria bacterium]|nr:hypothetical protein [Deltaproteobacteria bacterium]